jgi:hypothetical protein
MTRTSHDDAFSEAWYHRQAYNVAAQLPEMADDALRVLEIVKALIETERERPASNGPKPSHEVSASSH